MTAKQDGGGLLRRTFRSGKMIFPVIFALTSALVALSPLPSFAGPPTPGKTTSVPIPLGKACEWAYPGQSNGGYSGRGNSVVCLGKKGQVLGRFKKPHSLNAWCANSRHTDGKYLPTPALVKGVWVCTLSASGHGTGLASGSFTTPTSGTDIGVGYVSASGSVRNLPHGYRLDLFLKFADGIVYYAAGDPNTTLTVARGKWSGRIGVGSHAPTAIYIYLVELSPSSVTLMNTEVNYQNNGFPSITALGTILARVRLNLN